METIATTTCVNQVTYQDDFSITKNGGTPAYDIATGDSILVEFDSINPIFGTYNASVIPSGMICKTQIASTSVNWMNANISIIFLPQMILIFLMLVLIVLKIFEFKNPWKN